MAAAGFELYRVRSSALRQQLPQPSWHGDHAAPASRECSSAACAALSLLLHLTQHGSQRDGVAATAWASPFVRAYDQELSRVRSFIMSSSEELWICVMSVAQRLVQTLSAADGNGNSNMQPLSVVAAYEQECDKLGALSKVSIVSFLHVSLCLLHYNLRGRNGPVLPEWQVSG